jgi:hypothetical protein
LFELAFAHLGLGELDEAQALFTAPELVWAPDVGAMPWSAQLRLREGLARVWLARGDPGHARGEAEALQTLTASADEPAPRAVAARLLAEIAVHDGRLSEAELHIREAFAAIEGREVPLVEWRIAATAARLHHLQGQRAAAEAARLRSAALVNQLADSLPPEHRLRTSFLDHSSLREVLRPRQAMRRSRRKEEEVAVRKR